MCVCASFGKLFDFPVFLLDPGPILNIINFNFQCVLSREPAHQYTAAALTQMPDCISTNEVKKFCFFNKQHEKFTANYILRGDDNIKERFDQKELVKGNYGRSLMKD